MTSHYPIVLEHESNGTISAYVVGLPGVFAAADTERAAGAAIRKALRAHLAALHMAVAAVQGMDYLLSWNCTHIANATIRRAIDSQCRASGYEPPVICTPQELIQR